MPILAVQVNQLALLGFDAKKELPVGVPTIDSFIWPTDEEQTTALLAGGGKATSLELVMCDLQLAETASTCVLAVVMSSSNLPLLLRGCGENSCEWRSVTNAELLNRGWVFLGIDIVELSGLFSVHGIDGLATALSIPTNQLLQGSIENSAEVADRASKLVPEHSPFIPILIYCFTNKQR